MEWILNGFLFLFGAVLFLTLFDLLGDLARYIKERWL